MSVNPYRPQPNISRLQDHSRTRSWRVELLDRNELSLGFIGDNATSSTTAGIESWDVAANENSRVGLSGTLNARGALTAGGVSVDWSQHRIRIWESVAGVGEWPLGVLMAALPEPEHNWRDTRWSVSLIGKLHAVQRSRLLKPWAISKTTQVTGRIIWHLQQVGEGNRTITETTQKLPNPVFWKSTDSRLTVINELAGAIGYQGLRADPTGLITSAPYVLPGDRPVARRFLADEATMLAPEWSEEWNLAEVPNVYFATSSEVDGATFEAYAEDWDVTHPTSIPRRGGTKDDEVGRVFEVEEGVEVATQEALQAHVNRRLSEAIAPSQRVQVSHLSVPTVQTGDYEGLWVGQKVTHGRPGHDEREAVVEKMEWSSDSHMCAATWRLI